MPGRMGGEREADHPARLQSSKGAAPGPQSDRDARRPESRPIGRRAPWLSALTTAIEVIGHDLGRACSRPPIKQFCKKIIEDSCAFGFAPDEACPPSSHNSADS